MPSGRKVVVLTQGDWQEIFALFSSPTDEERKQVYDESSPHFYEKEDLEEEYSLTQEKIGFAEDAWRAVAYFLHRRGYVLKKDGVECDLAGSSGYSVETAG